MKKILLAVILLSTVTACGAPLLPGPEFTPYLLKDPNKVIVYIYRPYGEDYGWGRRYVVMNSDNDKKIIIKHGGYYPMELNPGKIVFATDRSTQLTLNTAKNRILVNLEKGKTYYVRLHTITNAWSFDIYLANHDEFIGLKELETCRLQTDEDLVSNQ